MEEKEIIKSTLDDPIKIGAVFGGAVAVIITFILTVMAGAFFEAFLMIGIAAGVVIAFIFKLIYLKTEIVVSNKRVYGKTAFGKQVDLPFDSISAVGTGMFNGIAVSTSSGRIIFHCIRNRDEVKAAITELLMNRQNAHKAAAPEIKQEIHQSDADELKKFKELLDSGIITQEEFDAKKKQLLGL